MAAKKKSAKRSTIPRKWRGKEYAAPKKKRARTSAGKQGTAKRKIYRSGGSKNVLRAFGSLSQKRKKRLVKAATTNPSGKGLTQIVRKRVMESRRAKSKNPVTGKKATKKKPTKKKPTKPLPPGQAPVTTLTLPRTRNIPSRMRGFGGNY